MSKKTPNVSKPPGAESSPSEFRNEPRFEDPVKYVVVRNDQRVSDNEYSDPDDFRADDEKIFWQRVVTNWSPGEKVEIVKFNKKKHRNW